MYYLKHAVPDIDEAQELVFIHLSGSELYVEKLIEDCLYFCPGASVSVKMPGEMPRNSPDHVFLLTDGRSLYAAKGIALSRHIRTYLGICNSIVVYGIGTERIFTLNKANYKYWWCSLVAIIIFRAVSEFSPTAMLKRLVRKVKNAARFYK